MLDSGLGALAATHLDNAQQHRYFEENEVFQCSDSSLGGYPSDIGACSWDLSVFQIHCRGLVGVCRVISSSMPHIHPIRYAKGCSTRIIAGVETVHLVHTCSHKSVAARNASDRAPDEMSVMKS
jgi:hypothetical protein